MLTNASRTFRSITSATPELQQIGKRSTHNDTKPLTAGKAEDAKKADKTSNTNIKDSNAYNMVNILTKSQHLSNPMDGVLLIPIKNFSGISDKIENHNEEASESWTKFVADTHKTKHNECMKLCGENIPTAVIRSSLRNTAALPAVKLLGIELRNAGIKVDQLPTFWPQALYGGQQEMFIAHTHGLRESHIAQARQMAAAELDGYRAEYPGCTFILRSDILDTKITREHPTFQKLVTDDTDANPNGQAHHQQDRFCVVDKDGNIHVKYTIEATGAANHPTGENAENPSFSYNGDNTNVSTNILPVRTASKDGIYDLSSITPYSKADGAETNQYYAIKGNTAQMPKGLHYKTLFSSDLILTDKSSLEALSYVKLTEYGGQVIYEDDTEENTDLESNKSKREPKKIMSAGGLGTHAQSGGAKMCGSAGNELKFGQTGLSFIDNGRPFLHKSPSNYDSTYDVFVSTLLHSMSSDMTNIVLRDGEGKVIPPEQYMDVVGKGTIELYRQTIVDSIKKLPPDEQTDAQKEILQAQADADSRNEPHPNFSHLEPMIVMVNGVGVNIPINLRHLDAPGKINHDAGTLTNSHGRLLHARYTPAQQVKDFGRRIDASSPLLPKQQEALEALFKETAKIYRLTPEATQRCLNMLLPDADTSELLSDLDGLQPNGVRPNVLGRE